MMLVTTSVNWSSTLCCTTVPSPVNRREWIFEFKSPIFVLTAFFFLMLFRWSNVWGEVVFCQHVSLRAVSWAGELSLFVSFPLLTTLQTPFLGQQGEKSYGEKGQVMLPNWWIFGKILNGLWLPPLNFRKVILQFFRKTSEKGALKRFKICSMNFWIENDPSPHLSAD